MLPRENHRALSPYYRAQRSFFQIDHASAKLRHFQNWPTKVYFMFGNVDTQKHFISNSVNQIVHGVSFRPEQLTKFSRLLRYILCYSNMSVVWSGAILIMILVSIFVEEIDSTKLKYMWLKTHFNTAFPVTYASETFRNISYVLKDPGSDHLSAYWAIEDACGCYRQDKSISPYVPIRSAL